MYAELAQSVHSASIRFERLVGGRDVWQLPQHQALMVGSMKRAHLPAGID